MDSGRTSRPHQGTRGIFPRLGAASLLALAMAGTGACELVLGALPPVGQEDGGRGGGSGGRPHGSGGGGNGSGGRPHGSGGGGNGTTNCPLVDGGVDLQTDPDHCGSCGNVCSAPLSGPTSGKAACKAGTCAADCNTTTGLECALDGGGSACVNGATDPQFCGSCLGHCAGGETCIGGACVPSACSPGLTSCSGVCANTSDDPKNCGACGKSCALGCQAGGCSSITLGCGNLTACGATCVDVTNDAANCGACGKVCMPSQVCIASTCTSFQPASGQWECAASMPTFCTIGGLTLCIGAAACP